MNRAGLSVKEVSNITGLSESAIKRKLRDGKLKGVKFGSKFGGYWVIFFNDDLRQIEKTEAEEIEKNH